MHDFLDGLGVVGFDRSRGKRDSGHEIDALAGLDRHDFIFFVQAVPADIFGKRAGDPGGLVRYRIEIDIGQLKYIISLLDPL